MKDAAQLPLLQRVPSLPFHSQEVQSRVDRADGPAVTTFWTHLSCPAEDSLPQATAANKHTTEQNRTPTGCLPKLRLCLGPGAVLEPSSWLGWWRAALPSEALPSLSYLFPLSYITCLNPPNPLIASCTLIFLSTCSQMTTSASRKRTLVLSVGGWMGIQI